ncbi:MAG: hypothetical protein WCK63_12605 [Betaproteobacteria bacterium]
MKWDKETPLPADDRGTQVAMIYALAAERLTVFYEHGQWLTIAQGATLLGDWLGRTQRRLPSEERKHLSEASDELARQIAAPLSREAGLFTAHEMMESLDPNYHSEISQALMEECERLLDRRNEV